MVALGVSDNQQSGFLEFLGDLVGKGSGDPPGGGGSGGVGVLSELIDGSLPVLLGTDDDDFREGGDGGDDPGSELNSPVDLINFEDVVASLVPSLNEGLHLVIDLLSSEVDLGYWIGTDAAKSFRISLL